MVRCPGLVLIILISLLLDTIGLGFFLALSIILVLAVTISVIVVIETIGKTLILGSLQRRRNPVEIAGQEIETLAKRMIMALATPFLAAAF